MVLRDIKTKCWNLESEGEKAFKNFFLLIIMKCRLT